MKKTTLKIWLENAWVPLMPETDSRVVHMGETGKSLELWAQEHSEVFANHTTEFAAFKETMGQPGGIATLNESGQIPSTQLPSYVDDVIEGWLDEFGFATFDETHPSPGYITPTSGKIYIDINTGLSYRWASGSKKFIPISSPVELGTGVEQAYPGNLGQANADAIASIKADYIKSTDYATNDKAGVLKVSTSFYDCRGIMRSSADDVLLIRRATNDTIDARVPSDYIDHHQIRDDRTYPICPANLDYATMSALADCKDTTLWTDDTTENGEVVKGTKTKACELLGTVRDNQYATAIKAGVIKVTGEKWEGLMLGGPNNEKSTLAIRYAENGEIDQRQTRSPITPINLDYAVLSALTTNSLTPTDEQLKAFYKWIGAVQYYYEARNGIARFINGQLLVNTPTESGHATTKGYVDGLIAGLQAQIDALKNN